MWVNVNLKNHISLKKKFFFLNIVSKVNFKKSIIEEKYSFKLKYQKNNLILQSAFECTEVGLKSTS